MHTCCTQADEPEFTRHKVRAFLHGHTCYELIPESGKVVVLDVGLPIRQAFHALHEQARAQTLHRTPQKALFQRNPRTPKIAHSSFSSSVLSLASSTHRG